MSTHPTDAVAPVGTADAVGTAEAAATTETDGDVAQTPSRRGVLRGVAAAGGVALVAGPLAACSSEPSANPSGPPTGAGGGRPTGAITEVGDVPQGGGAIVDASGTKVVVTQPEAGVYKAFTAICTHSGCRVNRVVDDVIRCPCHGSEFDASTGAALRGPAVAPLASIPIAVRGSTISFA